MTRLGAMAAVLLLLLAPAPAMAQAAEEEAERVALIERIRPSVVQVKALAPPRPAAAKGSSAAKKRDRAFDDLLATMQGRFGEPRPQEGSGFVVDSARGLILTAAHIVAGNSNVRIVFTDGSEREAAVAATDDSAGIALLRVAGDMPPALELSANAPRAGEHALLLGWMIPLKSVLAFETMVTGPASSAADKTPEAPSVDYVALDVAIPNGGFGGGPVIGRDGKVVGVVSAIYGTSYGPGALTLIIPAAQIAPRLASLSAGVP